MTKQRLGASLLILLSIIFLPYWIYLPVLLAGIIIFPMFWEGVVFGLLIDVLYGWGITAPPSLISPMALVALVFIVVLFPVREHIRFHV